MTEGAEILISLDGDTPIVLARCGGTVTAVVQALRDAADRFETRRQFTRMIEGLDLDGTGGDTAA